MGPENKPELSAIRYTIEEPRQYPSFWCGRVILVRDTPATIMHEVWCCPEDPYVEAYDAQKRYYKIPIERLRLYNEPVVGYVEPEKVRNGK